MTFEELLEKVKAAKNLIRVIQDSGSTYIRESFVSDEYMFGWVVTHPAKGFEHHERHLAAAITSNEFVGDDLVINSSSHCTFVTLTSEQLFQFREALAMQADGFEEG